jgi:hypothetical protein
MYARIRIGNDFEYLKFLFYERMMEGNEKACWIWQGHILEKPDNYGMMCVQNMRGKRQWCCWAHRLSWEIYRGEIPEGMNVLHTCDTPPCVNPNHLFLGTRGDNNHDRHRKSRTAVGEEMPQHKLTEEEVIEIREKYATGQYIQQELADEYGVAGNTISYIVNRKRWKHLNMEASK